MTFRNSTRHLVGTWLLRLPALVVVISAFDRYEALLPWWWFEIFVTTFLLITVPVLMAPVWAAWFRTLTVDGDVVVLRLGWFAPETRVTTRAHVTSVQVDEPLSQRLSGVRSVTILTSGVMSSTIDMPALLPGHALDLERLLLSAASPPASAAALSLIEEAVPASPGVETASLGRDADRSAVAFRLLYRASPRDILVTSVSGGYVLVMAAAVIGAAQEFGGFLRGVSPAFSWGDPRVWVLAIVGSSLSVSALVAARFANFRIEQAASGEIRMAYGALERRQHHITPGEVVAVTLMRTPVDLASGTARLIFSTAWISDGSHKRLVFPSMPPAVASRVVADMVGRQIPELFVKRSRWWAAGFTPRLAAAALAVVGLPAVGPTASAMLVGGGVIVTLAVARYVFSTVSATPSHDVVCQSVGLSHKVSVYLPGAASSVVERRVPGVPIRNVTVLGWAHRRFVHRVPVRSADVAVAVRRALSASVRCIEGPTVLVNPATEEICAPVR